MGRTADFGDLLERIFPPGYELVPGINELYELRLARLEADSLSPSELRSRGAYFAHVLGRPTNHFLVCTGAPLEVAPQTSIRLRTFFEANQFKTGYATHGFFPYRGKFHPQMTKGLLNVLGLEPGDRVLDPMMGSGTVLVEAALMGIESVGVDTSPLCLLMTEAKLAGLRLDPTEIAQAASDPSRVFDRIDRGGTSGSRGKVEKVLRLAYLDALGFAARRKQGSARDLFAVVVGRYARAIEKFTRAAMGRIEIASALPLLGDARSLPLADGSVQGVLFSPPYSFAVDYLENDSEQLVRLGSDVGLLRERMVGLRGDGRDRVDLYFEDMATVVREVARVLSATGRCCVVVGSNTKQLGRLMGPGAVGIESRLVDIAAGAGLSLIWRTTRQITGIANSMRDEHILLFESRANPSRSGEPRQLSLLK